MKRTKFKQFKSTILKASVILLLASTVISPACAAFDKMPVTGNGRFKLTLSIKDTKNITHYSGVEYMRYQDTYGDVVENWSEYKRITNTQGSEIPPVNDGEVTMPAVQLMDYEGIHNVCIQLKDHADTIHGQGLITGDELNGTSNESGNDICNQIFYDKSKPVAEEIILNGGNHWINKGEIPVTMKLSDNRAGIEKITYETGFGTIASIPVADIQCLQDNDPASGTGTWACSVNSTLVTNPNRANGNQNFKIHDKVGNVLAVTKCSGSYKNSCIIDYDLVNPTGLVDIKSFGGGTNGQGANVDIHVQDLPSDPWVRASGIEYVKISNLDGSNEKVLLNKENEPDPSATFDSFIKEYVTSECPSTVAVTIRDKAGNEMIVSSEPRSCTILKVSDFQVLNVVNPKVYTLTSPFVMQNWNFDNSPQHLNPGEVTGSTPYGTLPTGVAGGNVTWDMSYQWDGDPAYSLTGYYTVKFYNEYEGYEESSTSRLTSSDFNKIAGSSTAWQLKPQTFTIPKKAPSSKDGHKTYVAISVMLNITTIEGGANKTQTIYFTEQDPEGDGYGRIVEVVGSMDDYLYFGELN